MKNRSALTSALTPVMIGGLTAIVSATTALATPVLAPHRAVYDISLKDATDRSGITSMNGRIVYEFGGSACEGYTTSFRFVTRMGVMGESRTTDQRTATFEEADGSMFQFVTRTFVNDRPDREISGTAMQDDGTLTVELEEPEDSSLEFAPALFPSAHMIDLLTRADAGETFYEQRIFDGSDGGDRTMTTTVIIGAERTADDLADVLGDMAETPFRNVSITYFEDADAGTGEGLPDYGISFMMYDNGITRSLTMDYGEFALEGALTDLEVFEAESCE